MTSRFAGLLVLAAIGLGCGGDGTSSRQTTGRDGPLDSGADLESAADIPIDYPVSWGWTTLVNDGDQEAVLDSVSLSGKPAGIRVVAVRAAGPDRPHGTGLDDFPPKGIRLTGIRGTVVPPKGAPDARWGVEIVFGLEVIRPGRWRNAGVVVRYRVGDNHYEETFKQIVNLCAGPQCPPQRNRRRR